MYVCMYVCMYEIPLDIYITPGGGGVLPENLGRGVWPASQNPYPIYDLTKNFIPYLCPDS